ncbi:hypothetical protein J4Q44_G00113910 [Coregonus suidteri]|uniref:Uncharacterized protein n=1 Tax=Coregonus suidteri TaxID=861788 RepID=A0AAN8M4M4_9TELE
MTQWVWAYSTSRRRRRGRGQVEKTKTREQFWARTKTREQFWARFREEVMDTYLVGLQDSLDQRFQHLEILGAFSVLGPQAAFSSERINTFDPPLQAVLASARGCCAARVALLQATCASWSIQVFHVFQGLDQLTAMTKLASQFDEWGQSTHTLASWQQSH